MFAAAHRQRRKEICFGLEISKVNVAMGGDIQSWLTTGASCVLFSFMGLVEDTVTSTKASKARRGLVVVGRMAHQRQPPCVRSVNICIAYARQQRQVMVGSKR